MYDSGFQPGGNSHLGENFVIYWNVGLPYVRLFPSISRSLELTSELRKNATMCLKVRDIAQMSSKLQKKEAFFIWELRLIRDSRVKSTDRLFLFVFYLRFGRDILVLNREIKDILFDKRIGFGNRLKVSIDYKKVGNHKFVYNVI